MSRLSKLAVNGEGFVFDPDFGDVFTVNPTGLSILDGMRNNQSPREHTVAGTIQARFPGVKVETLVKWDEKQGFTVFKVGSLELRKCSYYMSPANNRPGLK